MVLGAGNPHFCQRNKGPSPAVCGGMGNSGGGGGGGRRAPLSPCLRIRAPTSRSRRYNREDLGGGWRGLCPNTEPWAWEGGQLGGGAWGGGPAENNQDGEAPQQPAVLPQPGPAGPTSCGQAARPRCLSASVVGKVGGFTSPRSDGPMRLRGSRQPSPRGAGTRQSLSGPPAAAPFLPSPCPHPQVPGPVSLAPSPGLWLSDLSQPPPHHLDPSCHVVGSPHLSLSRDCRVRTGKSPLGAGVGFRATAVRSPSAGTTGRRPCPVSPAGASQGLHSALHGQGGDVAPPGGGCKGLGEERKSGGGAWQFADGCGVFKGLGGQPAGAAR